jgi:hypothetical protein
MSEPKSVSNLDLPVGAPRRDYARPQLRVLGDLRDITLGGSAGIGDSGSAGTQKCPGGCRPAQPVK